MPVRTVYQTNPSKLEPLWPFESSPTIAVEMAPNLTIAKGTVLGRITASAKYSTYASANSDGTQNAEVIAAYDCVTDANGLVYLGTGVPTTAINSTPELTLECYYAGPFDATKLVGMDATAITAFKARSLKGGAIIYIP